MTIKVTKGYLTQLGRQESKIRGKTEKRRSKDERQKAKPKSEKYKPVWNTDNGLIPNPPLHHFHPVSPKKVSINEKLGSIIGNNNRAERN